MWSLKTGGLSPQGELEQLECLCSEDTPAALWLPILLTSSYWIPSQNKTVSYKFKEFAKTSNFLSLKGKKKKKKTLHATHLLKLLDKVCKYEMDPVSIVEDT